MNSALFGFVMFFGGSVSGIQGPMVAASRGPLHTKLQLYHRPSYSLVSFLILCLIMEASAFSTTGNPFEIAEKEALLSFKSGITHDPRGILRSWNSSATSFPCNSSWTGISCTVINDIPRVTSLDLHVCNLAGVISGASLSNLTHLVYLNLSVNSFTDQVPVEFGLLSELAYLDLKRNILSGPIPPELGNCSSLLWLDLSHNENLIGMIPPSLGWLSKLYMLQLHDLPNITGSIPPQLGNLTNATYVYFGGNSLSGKIPSELGNLVKLQELYLYGNSLNGTIPPELGRLQNLQTLALFTNAFESSIPPQFGNLTNLEYMWCFICKLHGTIPLELGKLQNLKELDLSNNDLEGRIPAELGNLKNLQILKLFINNLNGSIPKEFGNLKHLQQFYAQSNVLSGVIPPEVGEMESLQILHLYYNKLFGSLPAEIGKLGNLTSLILFTNQLSGEIPAEIGNLKSLTSLYLGDNHFSGQLPAKLGDLESLQYFEVSPNDLVGPIPSSLGSLLKLVYIDLSKNKFSGSLPVEIVNCKKVEWIKLSNNSFSGEIPREYSSFEWLHTLSVAKNNLTGTLPESFVNYTSLVVLDFSHNQFTGHLPNSWAQLQNLRVLSAGYNSLTGPLPSWLWSLNYLQVLELSNNQFSGLISSDLGQVDGFKHNASQTNDNKTLWRDDMSFDTKGLQIYYKYILRVTISLDLSANLLSGPIPSEIGLLTGLFNLNLSNNQLTGSIPSSLGNVQTLESVDLSNNQLMGEIPSQLTNLTYLEFLNLSNNELSGSIPKGGQFDTFSIDSYRGNKDLCGKPLTIQCQVGNTVKKSIHHIIISIVVILVTSLFSISIILCYFVWKTGTCFGMQNGKVEVFDKRIKLSASELSRATMGYSDTNIIGEGGSSIVYKGVLRNGIVVAVKKMILSDHVGAEKSFHAEVTTLGKVRHRNLVKLLGTVTTGKFKCLVLDFIPNGNLEMHLYKETCDMNWESRLNIALGVAHGLVYLHHETGFGQVLHCDLKPSNVLLDKDLEPHISDFGIAKLRNLDKDVSASTALLQGSIGYVAPEFAYGERLTDKVDVYSYGILLLEMLTRRRPTSDMFIDSKTLATWVKSAIAENWIDVIDPILIDEAVKDGKPNELYDVLRLAVSCVKDSPADRPGMRDVLDVLLHVKQGKQIIQNDNLDVLYHPDISIMKSYSNHSETFSLGIDSVAYPSSSSRY